MILHYCSLNGPCREDQRAAIENYGNHRLSQLCGDEIEFGTEIVSRMILDEYRNAVGVWQDDQGGIPVAVSLDIFQIHYSKDASGRYTEYPNAVRRLTRNPATDLDADDRRQILITTLWNAIDESPSPEAGFAALCELCPDAFDDPRCPNSLRFKYAETVATV